MGNVTVRVVERSDGRAYSFGGSRQRELAPTGGGCNMEDVGQVSASLSGTGPGGDKGMDGEVPTARGI